MFVFEGKLSAKATEHKSKHCNKVVLIWELCVFAFCIAIIAYRYIKDRVWDKEFLYSAAIILFVVIVLSFSFVPKKRLAKFNQKIKIVIDDENISDIGTFSSIKKPLSEVKKLLDMGDWYYIIFECGDITNSWICQKDLIKEGTIEEFEEFFKDKIVKK